VTADEYVPEPGYERECEDCRLRIDACDENGVSHECHQPTCDLIAPPLEGEVRERTFTVLCTKAQLGDILAHLKAIGVHGTVAT
jgi:hypothetical protein